MNRYPEDNQEEELGPAATHQPIGGSGGLPPLPPQQFNHLRVEEGDVAVGPQQRNDEDDYHNDGRRRSRTSSSGGSENIRDSMPENVKKLPLQEQLLTRVDALEEMVISLHARMDVFMEDFYAMFGNRLQQQEGNRQAASARCSDPPQATHGHHRDSNIDDRDDILNRLEDVIAISAGPSSHNVSIEADHEQHHGHHVEQPAGQDAMDDVRATPLHPRDQPQEQVEDVSTWDQTPESVVLSPPTQQNISVMSTTSGGGAVENSLMRGVLDGVSPQQGVASRSGNAQYTPTRGQLGSSPRRMASTSPLVERFHASQRTSIEETTDRISFASPQQPSQHHSASPPRRTPQHKDLQISPLQDGAMPIVKTRQPSPNQQYQSPQQQPSGSRSPTRTTPRAPAAGAAVDTTQSPNRSARKEQLLSAGLETDERKKEPILFLTSTENRYNARSHGGLVLSERNGTVAVNTSMPAMNISDTSFFSPLQRQHRQSDVNGSTLHQTVLSDWDVSPVKTTTTTTTTSASVNIIKEDDEDMILEREQRERIRQELNRRGEESHQHRHTANGDQQNTSSSFLADHLLDGAVPVNRHDKKEAETVQVQFTRHSQQQQQQSVSEQSVSRKKSAPEELSSETLLSDFSMISGTIVVRAADEKHTPKGGAKASNGTEVGSPGGEDKRTPPAQVKRRHHHNHHQHPVAPPESDDQQQQQDPNGVLGFNPKFTHSQRDVRGPPESQTQQQGHHLGGLPHNLGSTVLPLPTGSHDTSLGAVQVDSSGSISPFMSPPTATQRRGMADQAPVAFSRVDGGDDLGTEEKQPSHHHHHHASQQRTTAAATQSRHKESPGPKLLSPTLSSPADGEHSNGGRSRSRSSSSRQHNNPAETLKPNKRLPTKLSLSRSSQLGNSNKQQPSQLHTAESFARAKRRGSIDAILDESHEMIQKAATPTKSMEGPKQQLGGGGSGVDTRKRSKMQLFLQREAASHPDTVASPMKSKAMLQLAANKSRHNHHDVQVPPQGASTPTYEERKKRRPPLPPGSPDTDRTNTTNDGSYLVGAEDQAAPATINEFTGAASVEEPLSTPFATTYNSWEAVETNTEDVQPQTKKDEVQQQQQPHRRDVNGDPSRRKEENAHHNETTTEQSSLITLPDVSPIEKVPAADRYFADEEERNNKGKVEGGGGADSPASPKTSNAAVKRAMDEAAAAAAVDAARSGGTNNEPPVATVKASTAASADHVDLPKRKQPISAPVQMVASTQENVNSSSSYVQERRSTQVFQDTSEFNTGASTRTTTKEKSTNQPSVGATPPAPAPSTPPNMPQRKKKVLPDAFGSPSSTPPPAAEASLTSPGAAPAFDVGGFGTPSKATPVSAAPGGVGATFGSRAAAPTSKTLPSSTASPTTKMSAFDRMFAPKTPPPQQTTAIKPQVDTPSPPQSRHHAHRHHHHHHHGSKYHNFEDGGDTTISATMTNTSDSSSGGGDDDSTSLSFKEDELDDVEIDLDDD